MRTIRFDSLFGAWTCLLRPIVEDISISGTQRPCPVWNRWSRLLETLYSTNAIVVSLSIRAAAVIARCPLRSLSKSLPVYVKRILAVIREAGSTDSDMAQHSLKGLAVIIRDCPQSKTLTLLEFLILDIEESERQIAAFTL